MEQMDSSINFYESYLTMCRQHSSERMALYNQDMEDLQRIFMRHLQEFDRFRSNNSDIVAVAKTLCLQVTEIREFNLKKEMRRAALDCRQKEEIRTLEQIRKESEAINQNSGLNTLTFSTT